jgi:class I fructose-bisphosphate aldolase
MTILKKYFNMKKISRKNKFMFLAYDQGMEHGPADFTDKNVNPEYIIDLAKKGNFTALILQKGIAEKYNDLIKKNKIPLVVKLNGKTNLFKGEPVSEQLTTVNEAISLGANAVGFTLYPGSAYEKDMFREFEGIQREAHKKGLPVICWIYPRGKSVKGRRKNELMAYATRIGLELGADIIKIEPTGKKEDLAWAVKSAGRAKVVIAGGKKKSEKELLNEIKDAVSIGVSGLAIGRNVWQDKTPLKLAEKIRKVIFGK